jgi:septal ring factor EnvC (AmiA/AmiB activator)
MFKSISTWWTERYRAARALILDIRFALNSPTYSIFDVLRAAREERAERLLKQRRSPSQLLTEECRRLQHQLDAATKQHDLFTTQLAVAAAQLKEANKRLEAAHKRIAQLEDH